MPLSRTAQPLETGVPRYQSHRLDRRLPGRDGSHQGRRWLGATANGPLAYLRLARDELSDGRNFETAGLLGLRSLMTSDAVSVGKQNYEGDQAHQKPRCRKPRVRTRVGRRIRRSLSRWL